MIRMIKKNKLKLIISSIVILLPMLAGFICGDILEEKIAIHWGIGGQADGFASPAVAFTVIPLIMLAVHWICMIITSVIDKREEQSKKVQGLMFWIIPTITLTSCGMMLSAALGYTAHLGWAIYILIGIMFIVIGNYMPKIKRSVTTGVKIKWTMANDENWAATHRFCGKLWVAMGFVCILAAPLPTRVFPISALLIIAVSVVLPVIYSYRFYKKQLADGRATKEEYEAEYKSFFGGKKAVRIISGVIIALVAVLLIVTMFTGKIWVRTEEDALTIDSSFGRYVSISYEDISAAELRDDCGSARKVNGFNSAKLWLGAFESDELGLHTRYTYVKADTYLVLTVGERYVVIAMDTEEETREIYERVSAEIAERGEK